jgi:hypothetical protein
VSGDYRRCLFYDCARPIRLILGEHFPLDFVKHTMKAIMRMVLDIFGQVLRTLWAHKLRSFLTMFGVAWTGGPLKPDFGLSGDYRRCLFYDCAGSSRGTSSKICMISCILCFALP